MTSDEFRENERRLVVELHLVEVLPVASNAMASMFSSIILDTTHFRDESKLPGRLETDSPKTDKQLLHSMANQRESNAFALQPQL